MLCRILRPLPAEAKLVMLGDAKPAAVRWKWGIHWGANEDPAVIFVTLRSRFRPSPATCRQINQCTTGLCDSAGQKLAILFADWRFGQPGIPWAAKGELGTAGGRAGVVLNPRSGSICLVSGALPLRDWLKNVIQEFYLPVLNATDLDSAFAALSRFRILTPTRVGLRGLKP